MEAIYPPDCLEATNCDCVNTAPQNITCKDVQLDACAPKNPAQFCDHFLCDRDFADLDEKTAKGDTHAKAQDDITPTEAAAIIEAECLKNDLVILDVSTKREYRKWHLENAININFLTMKFRKNIEKLDKKKNYLIYCKMGCRSKMAQKMMKHLGFKNVYSIAGGRDRWLAEGLPIGSKDPGAVKNALFPMIALIVFVAVDFTNSCLTWLEAYPFT